MVGGEGFQDMALFGKRNQAWLEPCLDPPSGMPSPEPFGRVFARLHPPRLHEGLRSWTQAV